MTYFVYLIVSSLKNNKKTSYVGYTKNLKTRLKLHNQGKGAKFTRGKIDVYVKVNYFNFIFF